MISGKLQIFAIVAILIFFVALINLLRKNQLALKYSLLWLFSGLVMLILAIFPGVLDWFANLIGVYSAVNALFAVLICIGVLLMISFTVIISREKQEITRLVQEMAAIDKRLRDLEEKEKQGTEP